MKNGFSFSFLVETLLGVLFIGIGFINLFWGNDPFFGVFLILLAQVFFTPFRDRFLMITGFAIAVWIRVLVALFIIWSSIGVGELGDKVSMMVDSLK